MIKDKIIKIADSMGFFLDLDRFEENNFMRFELKKHELNEKDFRWIWLKGEDLHFNLMKGAQILFKAGQKSKIQQINQYVDL